MQNVSTTEDFGEKDGKKTHLVDFLRRLEGQDPGLIQKDTDGIIEFIVKNMGTKFYNDSELIVGEELSCDARYILFLLQQKTEWPILSPGSLLFLLQELCVNGAENRADPLLQYMKERYPELLKLSKETVLQNFDSICSKMAEGCVKRLDFSVEPVSYDEMVITPLMVFPPEGKGFICLTDDTCLFGKLDLYAQPIQSSPLRISIVNSWERKDLLRMQNIVQLLRRIQKPSEADNLLTLKLMEKITAYMIEYRSSWYTNNAEFIDHMSRIMNISSRLEQKDFETKVQRIVYYQEKVAQLLDNISRMAGVIKKGTAEHHAVYATLSRQLAYMYKALSRQHIQADDFSKTLAESDQKDFVESFHAISKGDLPRLKEVFQPKFLECCVPWDYAKKSDMYSKHKELEHFMQLRVRETLLQYAIMRAKKQVPGANEILEFLIKKLRTFNKQHVLFFRSFDPNFKKTDKPIMYYTSRTCVSDAERELLETIERSAHYSIYQKSAEMQYDNIEKCLQHCVPREQVGMLMEQAVCFIDQEKHDKAQCCYERALAVIEKNGLKEDCHVWYVQCLFASAEMMRIQHGINKMSNDQLVVLRKCYVETMAQTLSYNTPQAFNIKANVARYLAGILQQSAWMVSIIVQHGNNQEARKADTLKNAMQTVQYSSMEMSNLRSVFPQSFLERRVYVEAAERLADAQEFLFFARKGRSSSEVTQALNQQTHANGRIRWGSVLQYLHEENVFRVAEVLIYNSMRARHLLFQRFGEEGLDYASVIADMGNTEERDFYEQQNKAIIDVNKKLTNGERTGQLPIDVLIEGGAFDILCIPGVQSEIKLSDPEIQTDAIFRAYRANDQLRIDGFIQRYPKEFLRACMRCMASGDVHDRVVQVAKLAMHAVEPGVLNDFIDYHGVSLGTPMHVVAKADQVQLVTFLLSLGALPLPMNEHGQTPKDLTKLSGIRNYLARRDRLLKAKIEVRDQSGRHLPQYIIGAIETKKQCDTLCKVFSLFDQLMKKVPRPEFNEVFVSGFMKDFPLYAMQKGDNLLHKAAKENWPQMVRFLLKQGICPKVRNAEGKLPMECATDEKVRELLKPVVQTQFFSCGTEEKTQDLKSLEEFKKK